DTSTGKAHRRAQLLDRAECRMRCVPEETALPQHLIAEYLRVLQNRSTRHPGLLEVIDQGPGGPGSGDRFDGLDQFFAVQHSQVGIAISRVAKQIMQAQSLAKRLPGSRCRRADRDVSVSGPNRLIRRLT